MFGYMKFGLFVFFAGYAFCALLTAPFVFFHAYEWKPSMVFVVSGVFSAAPAVYLFIRWLYPRRKTRRNRYRQRVTVRA